MPDLPQLRSTCPSGVQYGHLVDIGRKIVDEKVPRPLVERTVRWALKEGLPSPLFAPAMKMGQAVRGLLPASLRAKVPAVEPAGTWPTREHARKVLMLVGCVQPAMMPGINTATARVLDAAGIQTPGGARGRLLRRRQVPPERPGRRPGANARQHRCLVAAHRGRRGRSHRHERLGLRRHRQRNTATCCATTRCTPTKPRAPAPSRATSPNCCPTLPPALQGPPAQPPQGVVASTAPARCSIGQQLRGG